MDVKTTDKKPEKPEKIEKTEAEKAQMYAYLRKKYGYRFRRRTFTDNHDNHEEPSVEKSEKSDKSEKKEKKPMEVSKYASIALNGIVEHEKHEKHEKKAQAQEKATPPEVAGYPSNADLRRMYDIIQADAKLTNKLSGLGFGESGDAYRKAALKLQILELMTVLRSGKNIRNSIVHKPGYVPSESSAKRAILEYGNADKALTAYLNSRLSRT